MHPVEELSIVIINPSYFHACLERSSSPSNGASADFAVSEPFCGMLCTRREAHQLRPLNFLIPVVLWLWPPLLVAAADCASPAAVGHVMTCTRCQQAVHDSG